MGGAEKSRVSMCFGNPVVASMYSTVIHTDFFEVVIVVATRNSSVTVLAASTSVNNLDEIRRIGVVTLAFFG